MPRRRASLFSLRATPLQRDLSPHWMTPCACSDAAFQAQSATRSANRLPRAVSSENHKKWGEPTLADQLFVQSSVIQHPALFVHDAHRIRRDFVDDHDFAVDESDFDLHVDQAESLVGQV